jgi:hypothetical protein
MRRHILVAGWLALTACLPLAGTRVCSAAEPGNRLCQAASLPDDVQEALGKYFTGWKIQDPTTLSPDMMSRWQVEAPTTCPGLIGAHFQGRRQLDYLLLLVDPAGQGYRLVAFRMQTANIYSFKVLELGASGGANRFLRGVSAAMRAASGLPSSKEGAVLVSSDGTKLVATLYFWDKEDFMRQAVPYPIQ